MDAAGERGVDLIARGQSAQQVAQRQRKAALGVDERVDFGECSGGSGGIIENGDDWAILAGLFPAEYRAPLVALGGHAFGFESRLDVGRAECSAHQQ